MGELLNVYCDESCHLEKDHIPVMVLGAVWCPAAVSRRIALDIRSIKSKHGVKPSAEIKWTKVSPAMSDLYVSIVDYFFGNESLRFRGVVIPDKSQLDHERFGQDHNIFYYKMFYQVLRDIIIKNNRHRIFLDIKDTLGPEKIEALRTVLHNANLDDSLIERIQHVRSHEVEQLQLTDLLIGALSYANRGLGQNAGKVAVMQRIQQHTGRGLRHTSPRGEPKFNVFVWRAQD